MIRSITAVTLLIALTTMPAVAKTSAECASKASPGLFEKTKPLSVASAAKVKSVNGTRQSATK